MSILSRCSLLLLCLVVGNAVVKAGDMGEMTAALNLVTDGTEWPTAAAAAAAALHSSYPFGFEADEEDAGAGAGTKSGRRALFWYRMRYYISYGALSANRVPCPPRSGRSYYTHNCYRARGPVHPYSRGCSAITRCRR